jgi:transposase
MNNITSLAIDLAKNVFQLHGTDGKGKVILKQKVSRTKLSEFMVNLPICNVYMEACGGSNYWGRKFEEFGHEVKLINPKYVKPYVKRNKNDANDAAGIAAAARDSDMRFCKVKTIEQQDIQSLHRIRSLLIKQKTETANQIRGLLGEYGKAIPRGVNNLKKHWPIVLSDDTSEFSDLIFSSLIDLYKHFRNLSEQVLAYDKKIKGLAKKSEVCQKLMTIPGIGELSSTILASVLGHGSAFENGRHFAAFLGLVPKQHSSGGKERLLGISKGGDTYIRTVLIHGARSVLVWVNKKTDKRSIWLKKLKVRAGANKTAVALANKIARTAWAVVSSDAEYNPNHRSVIKNAKKSRASSLAPAPKMGRASLAC